MLIGNYGAGRRNKTRLSGQAGAEPLLSGASALWTPSAPRTQNHNQQQQPWQWAGRRHKNAASLKAALNLTLTPAECQLGLIHMMWAGYRACTVGVERQDIRTPLHRCHCPQKSSFWLRSSHSVKTAELRVTEGSGGRLPLLSFALSAQRIENGTKISLQEMTGKPKVYHNNPADQRGWTLGMPSYLQHKLCWTKLICLRFLKRLNLFFSPENLM